MTRDGRVDGSSYVVELLQHRLGELPVVCLGAYGGEKIDIVDLSVDQVRELRNALDAALTLLAAVP